jgi:hypothetical protein
VCDADRRPAFDGLFVAPGRKRFGIFPLRDRLLEWRRRIA